MNDKLIELPKKGRLLVVSDLHGNYNDYEAYINLWDSEDPDFHIVFLGDLIHSPYFNDKSIEILDDVIEKDKKYSNFHVLLGNHEWAHITHTDIFKDYENQTCMDPVCTALSGGRFSGLYPAAVPGPGRHSQDRAERSSVCNRPGSQSEGRQTFQSLAEKAGDGTFLCRAESVFGLDPVRRAGPG